MERSESDNSSDDRTTDPPLIPAETNELLGPELNIDILNALDEADRQEMEDFDDDVVEEWNAQRQLGDNNDAFMREQRQLREFLSSELRRLHEEDDIDTGSEESNLFIQAFDHLKLARDAMAETDRCALLQLLRDRWRFVVPAIFSWPYRAQGRIERPSEQNSTKLIIALTALITNNENIEEGWAELCSSGRRTFCGKMFKIDGIVYQCWTCSTDPTTVLCSDCFMHSEHRHHNYRMASSSGGGFCDCGDVESWSAFPHCSLHSPEAVGTGRSEEATAAREARKQRICNVLDVLVEHCVDVLSWNKYNAIPSYMENGSIKSGVEATVIYNDEIHSYMEVTMCLSSCLGVSRNHAYECANQIDKDGRLVVCVGSMDRCHNMKKYIDVTMAVNRLPSIVTAVIPAVLLSHQEFALLILTYIEKWIGKSEFIRESFCSAVSTARPDEPSLLERILLLDDILWKSTRALFHKILVNSFLEPDWKIVFADAYIKNYPTIINKFLASQDETLSFAELSVQLLTTPSLALHLLTKRDALRVIAHTFLGEIHAYKQDGVLFFDGFGITRIYKLRKTLRILADIRYLLSAIPNTFVFDESNSRGLIFGCSAIVDVLSALQGTGGFKRARLAHVQHEPEWETAFNIMMRLITSIRLLLRNTKQQDYLSIQFLNHVIYALKEESRSIPLLPDYETVEVFNHFANCVKFDMMTDTLSVHYPLTRLLIGCILNCLDFISIQEISSKLGHLRSIWIFEHGLRMRVLSSQIAAGLWKRNGLSLIDQITLSAGSRCRAEMSDRDLMALQIGAACMDPNEFLIHVMNRFRIITWIRIEELHNHRGPFDGYLFKQVAFMVEEFLDLILQILLERYNPSIGVCDWQTMLQRSMIHSLCCKSQAHNELFKDIDDPDDKKNFDDFTQTFDEILREIAEVRKSTSANKSQYNLKPEYFAVFSPYFWHYTRADRNHAEQYQLEMRKLHNLSDFIPIPLPPMFRPALQPVVRVLDCEVMFRTIETILSRCLTPVIHPSVTEAMLRKTCHLLMLLLAEEKRGIIEGIEEHVRFVTTDVNAELVGRISELLSKLLTAETPVCEQLKPMICHITLSIHEISKLVDESAHDKSILIHNEEQILASLSFQEQKQLLAKKKRKALAEVNRAKVLARMSRMKSKFINANEDLYNETVVQRDLSAVTPCVSEQSETEQPEVKKARSRDVVLLGCDATELEYPDRRVSCILCQESRDVNQPGPLMGILCHRQVTKFLGPCGGERNAGVIFNTCGHTMHHKCYENLHDPYARANWSNVLTSNYGSRSYLCVDTSDLETLCPFCNAVCNIFIPFWPETRQTSIDPIGEQDLDFNEWLAQAKDSCQDVDMEQDDIPREFDDNNPVRDLLPAFSACDSVDFSQYLTRLEWTLNSDDVTSGLRNLFASYDNSLMKIQDYLSWSADAYFIHSFIYTVRSNIAWLQAENLSLYTSLPEQTHNLLEQLVIMAVMNPGVRASSSRNQLLRRNLEVIFNASRVGTEEELLKSLLSVAGLFARGTEPSTTAFIRTAFRQSLQKFITTFTISRHMLNVGLLVREGKINASGLVVAETSVENFLIMRHSLMFLRICAFFYKSIFRLPFSERLKEVQMGTLSEATALCEYLGLDSIIRQDHMLELCDKHLVNPLSSDYDLLSTESVQLIDLPYEYLPLLLLAARPIRSSPLSSVAGVTEALDGPDPESSVCVPGSSITFDDETQNSRMSLLCLHCGQVLVSVIKIRHLRSGQVGSAVSHMLRCSGYSGIFVKIKDCMILMLQMIKGENPMRVRGAMLSAPYVDQYGDTDDGLKRGYPLYRNELMLQRIKQAWYRQLIPHESSRYAHTHRIAFSLNWENL